MSLLVPYCSPIAKAGAILACSISTCSYVGETWSSNPAQATFFMGKESSFAVLRKFEENVQVFHGAVVLQKSNNGICRNTNLINIMLKVNFVSVFGQYCSAAWPPHLRYALQIMLEHFKLTLMYLKNYLLQWLFLLLRMMNSSKALY